jgi:uncharacterized protein (TIGR02001 family)
MKLKNLSYVVLVSGICLAGSVAQAEESTAFTTSGSMAFTSNYQFRGISQTSNNAAVQGGLTLTHESGVYASLWGSSIASGAGGLELDTVLGFAGKATEDVVYDVGVMRYNYPGANRKNSGGLGPDYNEVYGSISAYGVKVGVNYSPNYYADSDDYFYVYTSYSTEVQGFGLLASVGYSKFDSNANMAQALGYTGTDDGYVDYKVAVNKSFGGVGFELAYIGSDIKDKDLGGGITTGSAVATISKSF